MSLSQYARFLVIGAVVGLITVGCRELIGVALAADTVVYYSISVALAYAVGIVLSFVLNGRFTFGRRGARDWSRFFTFVAIAVAGLLLTWLLSLALRYGLDLQSLLGDASAAVAFAVAALCSAAVTYPLSALFVFHDRHERIAPFSRLSP